MTTASLTVKGQISIPVRLRKMLGLQPGDRIRFGAVVDFIQWHVAGYYWPAFNVADSAITLGAILLVWDQLTTKPAADNAVKTGQDK